MTTPLHRALSTLGLAWQSMQPGLDITLSIDESLSLSYLDGLWRPVLADDASFASGGLTTMEALGMTLAVRWAEAGDTCMYALRLVTRAVSTEVSDFRLKVKAAPLNAWVVCLPGTVYSVFPTMLSATFDTAAALPLAEALLLVRRTLWPAVPFRPRDQTAAALELHIRAMQAALRGPRAVETLVPETTASDIGRVW